MLPAQQLLVNVPLIHLFLDVFVDVIEFGLKFFSSLFGWEMTIVLLACSLQTTVNHTNSNTVKKIAVNVSLLFKT